MVIYNWGEHKDTPAIPALRQFLQTTPQPSACALPEILPKTPEYSLNPTQLTWEYLGSMPASAAAQLNVHIEEGIGKSLKRQDIVKLSVPADSTAINIPGLADGTYTWYIEMIGCGQSKQLSEPKIINITAPTPAPTPLWQRLLH